MKQNEWKKWVRCTGAIWLAILMTACGGGGDEGDDNNSNPAPNNPGTNSNFTPAMVANTLLRLTSTGVSRDITFGQTGNNYSELDGNQTTSTGTYTYSRNSGTTATLVMSELGGPTTVALTFGNGTSGSFQYTQGRSGSGTFTLQAVQNQGSTGGTTGGASTSGSNGSTNGSSTGTTTSGTTGTTTGTSGSTTGGTSGGLAYTSLVGRTMFGTRQTTSTGPSGQTHTYTFSSSGFHDSDPPEESDGNYTYNASGNTGSLVLNYTSPQDFAGERHEINMTYTEEGRGTFTSTYTRQDDVVIQIDGTFQFNN